MIELHVIIKGIGGLRLNEQIHVNVDENSVLSSILERILAHMPELTEYIDKVRLRPKPGILVLINNIDYNIISNTSIRDFLETKNKKINITIIPVNHGG